MCCVPGITWGRVMADDKIEEVFCKRINWKRGGCRRMIRSISVKKWMSGGEQLAEIPG